jgi:Arc/MetJ-type ribon-helix-helix transcriptional regulator
MYGMRKTTIYVPDDLKAALERAARALGRSEADLIRDGIRLVVEHQVDPEPRLPLLASGDPMLAEHVEAALEGFGER